MIVGQDTIVPITASPAKRRRIVLWSLAAAGGGVVAMAAVLTVFGFDRGHVVGGWGMIVAFAVAGVAMSIHDVRDRRLPDVLTLPLAAGLFTAVWTLALGTGDIMAGVIATGAALALTVLLFLGALLGGVGAGDLKLGLSIGLLTGWFGILPPVYALMVSFLLPLPYAIVGVIRRARGAQVPDLPFGPYLVAGGLVAAVIAAIG
jgi:leader peptidase (prepilin peptidase)/N-methyltransferase